MLQYLQALKQEVEEKSDVQHVFAGHFATTHNISLTHYTRPTHVARSRLAVLCGESVVRKVGCPTLAGVLLRSSPLTPGKPFLIPGGRKKAYDLALWALFRQVRLPQDDMETTREPNTAALQPLDTAQESPR